MTRGYYSWDLVKGFKTADDWTWSHPIDPNLKVMKVMSSSGEKYRVARYRESAGIIDDYDFLYDTVWLDRAIKRAAEILSDQLMQRQFCGS